MNILQRMKISSIAKIHACFLSCDFYEDLFKTVWFESDVFTSTNEYLNSNISKIMCMYVFVCVYVCMAVSIQFLKEPKTAYLLVKNLLFN